MSKQVNPSPMRTVTIAGANYGIYMGTDGLRHVGYIDKAGFHSLGCGYSSTGAVTEAYKRLQHFKNKETGQVIRLLRLVKDTFNYTNGVTVTSQEMINDGWYPVADPGYLGMPPTESKMGEYLNAD